jgi:hypothetical protein
MKYPSLTKPLLHTTFIAILSTLATPAVAHQAIVPVKNESGLTLASYETQNIQGWTVHIEKSALDHAKLKTALVALEAQLTEIKSFLNPEIVTKLKAVPIWLNKKTPHTTCYHPSIQWLKKNNRMPEKARSVELQGVDSFINTSSTQPMVMLHELAHAYHHRVLDFNDPVITKAFNQAVAAKSYEKVKHISGRIVRHYALTDEKEYFAEASEAYFGKNDYHPFNRTELKEHDPAAYAMVESVWQVNATKVEKRAK